jgi:hypothetical protein
MMMTKYFSLISSLACIHAFPMDYEVQGDSFSDSHDIVLPVLGLEAASLWVGCSGAILSEQSYNSRPTKRRIRDEAVDPIASLVEKFDSIDPPSKRRKINEGPSSRPFFHTKDGTATGDENSKSQIKEEKEGKEMPSPLGHPRSRRNCIACNNASTYAIHEAIRQLREEEGLEDEE